MNKDIEQVTVTLSLHLSLWCKISTHRCSSNVIGQSEENTFCYLTYLCMYACMYVCMYIYVRIYHIHNSRTQFSSSSTVKHKQGLAARLFSPRTTTSPRLTLNWPSSHPHNTLTCPTQPGLLSETPHSQGRPLPVLPCALSGDTHCHHQKRMVWIPHRQSGHQENAWEEGQGACVSLRELKAGWRLWGSTPPCGWGNTQQEEEGEGQLFALPWPTARDNNTLLQTTTTTQVSLAFARMLRVCAYICTYIRT